MDGVWAAYTAAFTLGAAHALEVDHMIAVTTFVGGRPRVGPAVAFGLRWGVGHAGVVFLVGGALAWSGVTLPAGAHAWGELVVGVTMILLGVWALRAAHRLHLHDPTRHGGHGHLHAHPLDQHPHDHAHSDPRRHHRHLSTLVGAVHGLAGTAPVLALVPVTFVADVTVALTYLALFGLGTVAAMAAYAALAALTLRRAARTLAAARGVARFTAGATMAVGGWWAIAAVRDLLLR